MQCKTVGQMKRIAHYGAMKMPGKYTFERAEWAGGQVFEVKKDEGNGEETIYHVDLTVGAGWCSCEFHKANRHLCPETTCKHCLWLSWMLEAEEVRWERQLAREIVRNGGGLGLNEVTGDSRLAKMFAHQFDEIEARTF